MAEAKKVNAIFAQITQVRDFRFSFKESKIKTMEIYNLRMRKLNARRLKAFGLIKELGLDNLDTRPIERHLQVP